MVVDIDDELRPFDRRGIGADPVGLRTVDGNEHALPRVRG